MNVQVASKRRCFATAVLVAWSLAVLGLLVVFVAGPWLMMGESGRARVACGVYLASGPLALFLSALLMTFRPAWAVAASCVFSAVVASASVAWYLATVERAGPQADTWEGLLAMIGCALLPGVIPHVANVALGVRALRERKRAPMP